jgi:DNA-binding transcriptional LysR family regulator
MSDEISDLRLFVRMAAAGSLSETARRLNTSLPAMSRRLAALESRLGVRLVDRNTRHFVLTQEGSLLYERGMTIVAEIDEVEAEVSARNAAPQGHIRVGAPLEIGRRQIAPLVAEFAALYSRVSIELVLSDSPIDVIGDDIDVALVTDQPSDGGMVSRLLLGSRRVACASPAYLKEHGWPSVPEDLRGHRCVVLVRGRQVFDRWTFKRNGKECEIQVAGALRSNNAEVLHGWMLEGRGIGLKAQWDIEDDLKEERLVEVLGPFWMDTLNLYAVFPTRRHLPPRVRVFLDFIVASMGNPSLNP